MNYEQGRRYFILSIWSQADGPDGNVWRGYLESASGRRTYFASLQRLNELLQVVGWQDGEAETAVAEIEHS